MKQCHFCTGGVKHIEYKDTETLKRFVDQFARIQKRRMSGVCAGHQRKLSQAIKRARFMALIPFVSN